MNGREVTLVEMIRDPGIWIYEASELERDGHYTLFRYDAATGCFSRATVPAGAACIHFRPMRTADAGKVPIGGWVAVERTAVSPAKPKLVD